MKSVYFEIVLLNYDIILSISYPSPGILNNDKNDLNELLYIFDISLVLSEFIIDYITISQNSTKI